MNNVQEGEEMAAQNKEEEEPDYLSDVFLIEDSTKEKTIKEPPRNRKVDEEFILQEGLAKPISTDNVGFKLLSKMGYDPLKHNQVVKTEIFLKRDRTGVGVAEAGRKQAKMMLEEQMDKVRERDENDGEVKKQFLKVKGEKFESRRLRNHLIKIRQVEENLREILGLESSPELLSFDPSEINIHDDDNNNDKLIISNEEDQPTLTSVAEEFIEPDYSSLLHERVLKLRNSPFYYCYWCGARFSDESDLLQNCPGSLEENHE